MNISNILLKLQVTTLKGIFMEMSIFSNDLKNNYFF